MEAILNREIVTNKLLCRIFAVACFVVLTALAAYIRIPLPFSPVPLTLQTMFVLLSAALLGPGLGGLSQVIYLVLGSYGIPIFAGSAYGFSVLFGPTGGYLLGFVISAVFLGKVLAGGKHPHLFILFIIADLLILITGTLWLRVIFGYQLNRLLFIGLLPFLPGDIIKCAIAAYLYSKLKPRLREVF